MLTIFVVPSAPGRSRGLVSVSTAADAAPLLPRLVMTLLRGPVWAAHILKSHSILDGDTALLHWQVAAAPDAAPAPACSGAIAVVTSDLACLRRAGAWVSGAPRSCRGA